MNKKRLKVAVLHYWLVSYRGGERVLQQILSVFGDVDIYTLFVEPEIQKKHFGKYRIFSSFLNCKPLRVGYKYLFPMYPFGVSTIKLQDKYDLIISSESGPIKGIANPSKIPHICYIHTPMRYCWGYTEDYLKMIPALLKQLLRWRFKKLRDWDYTTRNCPDVYVANSHNVKNRVKHYYQKDAAVIHPPVGDMFFYHPLQKEKQDYYLYLGAITPYKGLDLLIDAFNLNGKKLFIASGSKDLLKLGKKNLTDNIKLITRFSENDKLKLYANAAALIFPADEDFGIVPLEAMACGTPVIALKKGGALETVIENRHNIQLSTGVFFNEKSEFSLNRALTFFENNRDTFSPEFIRAHAQKFCETRFISEFSNFVDNFLETQTVKND